MMRAMTITDGQKYLGNIVSAGDTTGSTEVENPREELNSSRESP